MLDLSLRPASSYSLTNLVSPLISSGVTELYVSGDT